MMTQTGTCLNPLIFDGKPESWPTFKKALYQFLDKEGCGWVVEGGDAFCAMLKAASARRPRAPRHPSKALSQRMLRQGDI